jgi:geranyl-CoA carboxylase alpha subunit
VEFLLDDDGRFYFLEMNTRLQVEHPVTELVTGLDLVEWQLRVAEGEPLPLSQAEVALRGHAIEVRLYAEDPWSSFLPQTGPVVRWRPAEGEHVRVDSGIREGQDVSPFYDPMLAKVIAWGPTRDVATRRILAGLRDSTLFGVVTNRAYLQALLRSEAFGAAAIKTDTLDRDPVAQSGPRPAPRPLAWAVAAVALVEGAGWRSTEMCASPVALRVGDVARELVVAPGSGGSVVVRGAGDEPVALRVIARGDEFVVEHDGVRRRFAVAVAGDTVWVDDDGCAFAFVEPTVLRSTASAAGGDGVVRAPMGGRVVRVEVAVDDVVERGRTLAIVEAMKMEHRVVASVAGRVRSLAVAAGGQIAAQAIVAVIEPVKENEP